jgi:hypothetical protein
VEHLKGSSIGQAPVLPTSIRLSWKGLPGTNTLAYYENLQITDVKFFITLGPEYCNENLIFKIRMNQEQIMIENLVSLTAE